MLALAVGVVWAVAEEVGLAERVRVVAADAEAVVLAVADRLRSAVHVADEDAVGLGLGRMLREANAVDV